MQEIPVHIHKLHKDARIPEYQHCGDAGFDLYIVEDVTVPANGVKILPTGIAIAFQEGYELQIRLRSGIALNTPLILPNAPATIDAGYRGELGIIVRNLSNSPFQIKKGERIAQGVLARVFKARFEEMEKLPESDRGAAGYGSTGTRSKN